MLPWVSEVAVDLGTAHVHVAIKDGGVVVREPALVAYGQKTDNPVAFGTEAKQMLEQGVNDVRVVQPIHGGVVADFDAATVLVRHLLKKALGRRPLISPLVLTTHPTAATQVERRVVRQVLRASGAGRAILVQKALAAAIGAGLAVDAPGTQMVIDIGAGTTDSATVSMGMISDGLSLKLGGQHLDTLLVRGIKRQQDIRLTLQSAEEIKLHVGSLDPAMASQAPVGAANIGSFGNVTEDVRAFGVQLSEIPEMLCNACVPIADELRWQVEELPANVRAQLATTGAILTGGTALLRGLPTFLSQYIGAPVAVATDPMSCTMLGLQAVLNNLHALSLDGRRMTFGKS